LTAYEQYLKELPTIPITQAKKLIPFSQTHWTNVPTDKNKYTASWNWWQTFMQILTKVQPVKK
jgi:peptide/nickel transport system substrate-binding protein